MFTTFNFQKGKSGKHDWLIGSRRKACKGNGVCWVDDECGWSKHAKQFQIYQWTQISLNAKRLPVFDKTCTDRTGW